jgi:hypothetical protein
MDNLQELYKKKETKAGNMVAKPFLEKPGLHVNYL